jgi:hypothetical protein
LDVAALRIRLELLRHAREIGMGTRFNQIEHEICFWLKRTRVPEIPDATHFVEQQRILFLLAQCNHDEARTRLAEWDTSTADPIWSVRKAGLCLECGLRDEGRQLVFRVLGSIRRSGLSRETDVRMLSVEGLALFLGWYVHQSKEFSKLLSKSTRSTPVLDTTRVSRDLSKPDETAVPSDSDGQDGQINIKDAVERLHDLQDFGCDPNLLLDWLTLGNDGEPLIPNDVTRRLSFDLSWLISHSSGGDERLEHAYRAIRFIEEAGLPLRIERRSGVLVAEKLFSAASRTIAQFAPHEALGLALRSSDEKLPEEVLSRGCIAQLNQEQITFLLGAGRSSLEQSLGHVRPAPRAREMEDDWWATQFAAACIVLGRVAVGLDEEQLRDLAERLLDLPHDKRILGRISGPKELATLIRRVCGTMRRRTYETLLPRLLGTPLLGSDRLPNAAPRLVGDWYDPVGAISLFPRERWDRSSIDVAGDIETLIDIVARETGEWRKNAILRMLALRAAGLLSNGDERRSAEALYARTDPFGLPSDTGCYDSVVLGFPRVHKGSEIGMFRLKYISSDQQGENYWDELRRTVSRFGLPRGRDGRSIPWARGDLAVILDRAEAWLNASQSAIKPATTTDHPFRQWHQDSNQARYAAWLDALEDVVLLAANVTADLCERAARLLKQAEELGLNSIKTAATLSVLGLMKETPTVPAIKRSLGSRDERDVWQGCCAIARWFKHTRAARDPVIPPPLLSSLSNTISTRRHEKLALLINTAKDVVDTVPISKFPVGFLDELASGLSELFAETDYISPPFQENPFSTESRIHLRMVAARLARALLAQGGDSRQVRQCVEAASRDTFPEVRREVDAE